MLLPFPRCADHGLGLVAELGCELAMRGHHLAGRMNLFAVARRMRGDLGGFFPIAAGAFEVLADLLAARARCVKILLRVALDLRRAAAAGRDFVAKLAEPVGQLRLIDGRGKLLRGEEALRLQGARLAVVAFGHIEDDGVRMKLRRNIAVDGPGGVVLKLGGDKLAPSSPADGSRRSGPACSAQAGQARRGRFRDAPRVPGRRRRQAQSARRISARKKSRPIRRGAPSS